MAHRVLGIDVGKRAVKVAVVDKTLRAAALVGWDEEAVVPDGGETAQIDALRRLLQRNLRQDDVVASGLNTALCLHRSLLFPFRDDKSIAEAIGFELENHVPVPVEDLIVDHVRLGEKDGQTEVLALAARRDDVKRHLERLKAAGVDVRRLGVQSLAYASLVRQLPGMAQGVTMVCDVGTRWTEVSVLVDGRTQFLRSLSVGADSVEELFASQFEGAAGQRDLLASHGWLLPPGARPESSQEKTLHDATLRALDPLLRELRLTLSTWLRRNHTRPDRLLLTGGLARLRGVFDLLEQALGIPVEGVRLQDLPGQRLANAERLGDVGARAVAEALAAADPQAAEDDVDFRQGELAYEGDFKVLRARLPQIAAFFVIALCLLGIRTSLSYRSLVIEQEQQVARLQATSKQLTGKTLPGFDELLRELGREPAVDVAGLYPDMSAFKVLEEISALVFKVTEPPDYQPPGGPVQEAVPSVDPAMLAQRPAFRGLPAMDGSLPARIGDPAGAPPRDGGGLAPPGVMPGRAPMAGPGVAPGAEPGAGPGDTGDGATTGAGFTGHKIELSAVQIDRNGATLRGDVDTQEALLALQEAIDAHRCFGKAKSSSDRITFERHRDWFKFTLQFEIACPAAEKPAEADGDKAGTARKTGKAEDGEGAKAGADESEE